MICREDGGHDMLISSCEMNLIKPCVYYCWVSLMPALGMRYTDINDAADIYRSFSTIVVFLLSCMIRLLFCPKLLTSAKIQLFTKFSSPRIYKSYKYALYLRWHHSTMLLSIIFDLYCTWRFQKSTACPPGRLPGDLLFFSPNNHLKPIWGSWKIYLFTRSQNKC